MDLTNIICLVLSTLTIHFSIAEEKTSLLSAVQTSGDLQHPLSRLDKRAWSSFNTWGKRWLSPRQEEKTWKPFRTWGKRSSDAVVDDGLKNELKRAWKTFATWGKRTLEDDSLQTEKKWKQFRTWGKRSEQEKRGGWKTFATWGKRTSDNDDVEKQETERKLNDFMDWAKRRNTENHDDVMQPGISAYQNGAAH